MTACPVSSSAGYKIVEAVAVPMRPPIDVDRIVHLAKKKVESKLGAHGSPRLLRAAAGGDATGYTTASGDDIYWFLERQTVAWKMVQYVNGKRLIGKKDRTGIVRKLTIREGAGEHLYHVHDQNLEGSDDVPADVLARLLDMAVSVGSVTLVVEPGSEVQELKKVIDRLRALQQVGGDASGTPHAPPPATPSPRLIDARASVDVEPCKSVVAEVARGAAPDEAAQKADAAKGTVRAPTHSGESAPPGSAMLAGEATACGAGDGKPEHHATGGGCPAASRAQRESMGKKAHAVYAASVQGEADVTAARAAARAAAAKGGARASVKAGVASAADPAQHAVERDDDGARLTPQLRVRRSSYGPLAQSASSSAGFVALLCCCCPQLTVARPALVDPPVTDPRFNREASAEEMEAAFVAAAAWRAAEGESWLFSGESEAAARSRRAASGSEREVERMQAPRAKSKAVRRREEAEREREIERQLGAYGMLVR